MGISRCSNVLTPQEQLSKSRYRFSNVRDEGASSRRSHYALRAEFYSGQRRDATQGARLRSWLDSHVRPEFAGRILSVDDAVATRCAHLHVPDRRNEADALIAATALVHDMIVVTRKVRDFEGTGVVVVDPWQS
ncbi:type II toxin-antitoxin system VapC family toxin [Ensifer canadensis]|uniref:type II toxin-antitoxin system VapC family toxin n=1 Tax=Ensifer canadensis TaxID=555315 RepID=UPI0035E3C9A4